MVVMLVLLALGLLLVAFWPSQRLLEGLRQRRERRHELELQRPDHRSGL